jgi:hypothetical protein
MIAVGLLGQSLGGYYGAESRVTAAPPLTTHRIGGATMADSKTITPLSVRFWQKVRKGHPAECWDWAAALDRRGYGAIRSDDGRVVKAHRVSWELASGPVPSGLSVLHRCDRPSCVNPAHLFVGTTADNVRDMDDKGRRRTGPSPGEKNGSSKLTEEAVLAIRRQYAEGSSLREIAPRFGIDYTHVSAIVRGKAWRHVSLLR